MSTSGSTARSCPLDDTSCDAALCTFTLCTVPDPSQALAELLRVLKPAGTVHFLEHGLSPDPGVAKWQHRIEPFQRRLADGCHLTRDPSSLVEQAGFVMQRNEQRYVQGPKPWCWLTLGVAARAAGTALLVLSAPARAPGDAPSTAHGRWLRLGS